MADVNFVNLKEHMLAAIKQKAVEKIKESAPPVVVKRMLKESDQLEQSNSNLAHAARKEKFDHYHRKAMEHEALAAKYKDDPDTEGHYLKHMALAHLNTANKHLFMGDGEHGFAHHNDMAERFATQYNRATGHSIRHKFSGYIINEGFETPAQMVDVEHTRWEQEHRAGLRHPCGERVTPSNPVEKHRDCYYCNLARDHGHGYKELNESNGQEDGIDKKLGMTFRSVPSADYHSRMASTYKAGTPEYHQHFTMAFEALADHARKNGDSAMAKQFTRQAKHHEHQLDLGEDRHLPPDWKTEEGR